MKKNTKSALLLSVVSIIVCCTMLLGTTMAWFTDSVTSARNQIIAGNLDVELTYEVDDAFAKVTDQTELFSEVELWEPGVVVYETIKVANVGNLALVYNLELEGLEYNTTTVEGKEYSLLDVIKVGITTKDVSEMGRDDLVAAVGDNWVSLDEFVIESKGELYPAGSTDEAGNALVSETDPTTIVLYWAPGENDNLYNLNNDRQGDEALYVKFGLNLFATQLTYEEDSFDKTYDEAASATPADKWDGTAADYKVVFANYETTETFALTNAEEFAALSDAVNEGGYDFVGKTVTLSSDLDLSGTNFTPIGGVDKGAAFEGTFDGQGHTIYGLTENGWDLGYSYGQVAGMGLFGWVGDTTIKNVNIDAAEISMEAVVMGGVVGYATGDCTFENISVTNTQLANYNWDTGGIVGQAYGSGSTFTFKNITIDESTTISGHWGTWDVSAGGVIGRTADGVNVVMEDITVACVLDVYNDVVSAYQWYAYRYSGMLVGYTKTTETIDGRTVATAPHVTCKNVTVIYDDWANYTYCQFPNIAPQFVREQGGYSTDPYYSGRKWTAAVDINGDKVVDSNHVHGEGEEHSVLLTFDQLFGGGQGVYGTATHDGVTVIYNNK